jgi:hypothetical protein
MAAITDISRWVCGSCYRDLTQGKVPSICHLHYDPFQSLPEELCDLSAVENDLIAFRIPFMKLRALAPSVKGGPSKLGQLCLSGMVINVPTDLARIQVQPPREFAVDDTVTVSIKRRLRYRKFYKTENVRPFKILRALQFLTSHDTFWRSAGVRMSPNRIGSVDDAAQNDDSTHNLPNRTAEDPAEANLDLSEDETSSDGESADAHAYGEETLIDDGVADANIRASLIDIAPGGDQRPLSIYLDKNTEEMANPDTFRGRARPDMKYTYKKICRVELRHFRRLAAQRPCNIFFKFRKLQILDMKQLTWVRLRKSKLHCKPLLKANQLIDCNGWTS